MLGYKAFLFLVIPSPFRISYKTMHSKLCENIGIFIKNYKSTNPGSNKVVYGPCEQESAEKNSKFDFSIENNRSFVKKSEILFQIFLITLLCISKEASWLVDARTENQIGNFRILTDL